MLLDSIYYGKIPIIRVYKNHKIIWGSDIYIEKPVFTNNEITFSVIVEISDGASKLLGVLEKEQVRTEMMVIDAKSKTCDTLYDGRFYISSASGYTAELWLQQMLKPTLGHAITSSGVIVQGVPSQPMSGEYFIRTKKNALLIGQNLLPSAKYNLQTQTTTIIINSKSKSVNSETFIKSKYIANFWSQELMPEAKAIECFSEAVDVSSCNSQNTTVLITSRFANISKFWGQSPMPDIYGIGYIKNYVCGTKGISKSLNQSISISSNVKSVLFGQTPMSNANGSATNGSTTNLKDAISERCGVNFRERICISTSLKDTVSKNIFASANIKTNITSKLTAYFGEDYLVWCIDRSSSNVTLLSENPKLKMMEKLNVNSFAKISFLYSTTVLIGDAFSNSQTSISEAQANTVIYGKTSSDCLATLSKETASEWAYPIQTDNDLFITQTYSIVQEDTTLMIE